MYSFRNNQSLLFSIAIFIALSFVISTNNIYLPSELLIELKTQHDDIQIFYDLGDGFNESNSVKIKVRGDKFQKITVKLPIKKIDKIRLDTGTKAGNIVIIKDFCLENIFQKHCWSAQDISRDFTSSHDISEISANNNQLFVKSSGTDPYIVYTSDFTQIHTPVNKYFLLLLASLLAAFVYGLLSLIQRASPTLLDSVPPIVILPILAIFLPLLYNSFKFRLIDGFSFVASFGLLLTVIVLWIIGFLTSRAFFKGFWFYSDKSLDSAHNILLGQLILFAYVYLRSFINYLAGIVIPISALDFILLCGLLFLYHYRKKSLVDIFKEITNIRSNYPLTIIFIWILLLTLSQRELPRVIMLSSDPDQHAFWARQIQHFHTIPYTQFFWGRASFEYPAGFAVINFIWSSLSFMDVRNIVTVQPMIQTQFGILLILEAVWGNRSETFRKGSDYLLSLILVFSIYYFLIPYGYQKVHYHLEGTGRISSILLIAASLSFIYFQINHWRDSAYYDRLNIPLNVALAALAIAAAFLINPANLFYMSCIFVLGFVLFFTQSGRWNRLYTAIYSAPAALFPLLDPYYVDRLIKKVVPSLRIDPHKVTVSDKPFVTAVVDSLRGKMQHISSLFDVFTLDFATGYIYFLLFIFAITTMFMIKRNNRWQIVIIWVFPLIFFLLSFPMTTIVPALARSSGDSYLLLPYIYSNGQQFHFLWIFAVFGIIVASLARDFRGTYVLVVFLAMLMTFKMAEGFGGKIKFSLRKYYWGSMGQVNTDDILVIKRIEELFQDYKNSNVDLTYNTVPSILIPNSPLIMGNENWLFPHGAARILPLYDVFPVAFFYFQGNREYTFENYNQKICNGFDEKWLMGHNIKYLFIPSDFNGCVYGLDSIIKNKKVIVKSNNSMLVQLN